MEHLRLSEYKNKKGKLISPWNEFATPLSEDLAWFTGRLPEYLWIALILDAYERQQGINKCLLIIKKLAELDNDLIAPAWSQIIKLDNKTQEVFFEYLSTNIKKEILAPLTCISTISEVPIFHKYFHFNFSIKERLEKLTTLIGDISDHQTNSSTDIRYIVLMYGIMSGKMVMPKEYGAMLDEYRFLTHKDEKMRMIRPFIRSSEMMIINHVVKLENDDYLNQFWKTISEITECKCFYIQFMEDNMEKTDFLDKTNHIFKYYQGLVKANPLNNKLLVLTSLGVYSYKRLKELVEHSLFNEISGRSIVRNITENYIVMKYLLKHEKEHSDIWSDFQYYGIGKYKLIVQKDREFGKYNAKSHLNYPYMEVLIGEYTREEYIDMDLNYFDKIGIREKAIEVGEKALYDFLYDYDSQFEHGLWGAIRESALLKCNNPAHRFHCIPDVEDIQKLPSVWDDCKFVITQLVKLLSEEFGLPDHLKIEG